MNHYPRHIGDYLKKTIGLSMRQDGAYNRMMDLYYSEEVALPLDRADLYGSLRCKDKADREAVEHCLRKFFTETTSGFTHDRCEEELGRYRERIELATRASKAGVAARAQARRPDGQPSDQPSGQLDGQPDGQPSGDLTSNHKPVTRTNKPKEPRAPGVGESEGKGSVGATLLALSPSAPAHDAPRINRKHATTAGSRLPDDWRLPAEWRDWATAAHPELDSQRVVRISLSFRDHWLSKPGKDGRKANWLATWRNWIRREVERV